jgi:glycosyltransferase involved in cell wall biosynthesis
MRGTVTGRHGDQLIKDERTKGPEVRDQISEPKGQTVGIATGMRRMMEMTEEEREGMGARGRALVEERFTWPKVAAQMKAVYEWVLGTGPRPDCVWD